MSTIASGVSGALPGQAPSKGKAGHGAAGASENGDFALTIASLRSRDEGGERKGGHVSISGKGEASDAAQDPSLSARGKPDGRAAGDFAATIANLAGEGEAGSKPVSERASRERMSGAVKEGVHRDAQSTFGEKTVSVADAARPGRKMLAEGREGTRAGASEANDAQGTGEAKADSTDVGNLLELLGAAGASPHGIVSNAAGSLAASGAVQDAKVQGGKASSKTDLAADKAAGGRTDAAHPDDGADAVQSDTDQLFRMIRADGKGRDLDMNLNGAGDRATFRDANPTGPKGETVTVVDARRYIGLAQTGNAAAVTSAITQDPAWTASLSATGGLTHAEAAMTGKVVNTLKIQMNPIELGLVTATLRLHGDELVVSLQVETGEAYRQLTDDQDAIVRALRGQGFAVDQVTVQLSSADRGAGAQQGDGQGAQSQQQSSSQAQAREGGNGRERGSEQDTFGREGRSHEGNTEPASGLAGNQPLRSGGVYL